MSKIRELIKNEEVKWFKLGDICEFKRGNSITKKNVEHGEIPVIAGGRAPAYYHNISNRNGKTIAIAGSGAYAGFVSYWEIPIFLSDAFSIKPNNNVLVKYLFHFLLENQETIYSLKRGSGIPHVYPEDVKKIKLPVPSLFMQQKIVDILDNFTNYVTELQTELQNRSKQYDYYRDKLLSEDYLDKISKTYCDSDIKKIVKVIALEEIGEVCMCKRVFKEQTSDSGDIPFYKIGTFGKEPNAFISKHLFQELKEKYCFPKKGEVLLSASGTIGKAVIFNGEDSYFQDSNIIWLSNNQELVLNKYLYYLYQIINWNPSKGGTITRLYNYHLKKIKVVIPTLNIQKRVIDILDKFTDLIKESEGLLPKEISKRQKQYEYYREKLLTFDELSDRHDTTRRLLITNNYINLLIRAEKLVGIENRIKVVKLGEIGFFENGTGMPKSMFKEEGTVGAIHYGHIYTKYNIAIEEPIVFVSKSNSEKLKKVKYGDIVIAKTSENFEDIMKSVAYLGKNEAVIGGHAAIFRHNENPKYMSYVFNGYNKLKEQKNKFARGVKVIELSSNDMMKIKIPLPSRPVQDLIVDKLEKFEKLTNSIVEGLPREIELRQKQYEYYREKLLNFNRES